MTLTKPLPFLSFNRFRYRPLLISIDLLLQFFDINAILFNSIVFYKAFWVNIEHVLFNFFDINAIYLNYLVKQPKNGVYGFSPLESAQMAWAFLFFARRKANESTLQLQMKNLFI